MIQDWIHSLGEGGGARLTRTLVAVLGFIVVATLVDVFDYRGFSAVDMPQPKEWGPTSEGMEAAQIARNVARGDGFVTESIRPLALYMFDRTDLGSARTHLREGTPDLTYPPLYPAALAGVMKTFPFHFAATQTWFYQPDRWITIFNQVLLFIVLVLTFQFACGLFDSRVAWLSVIALGGCELIWQLTCSGLPTLLSQCLFLIIALALFSLDRRVRTYENDSIWVCLPLAIVVGVFTGLGTMTVYSFGWLILPVLIFCGAFVVRRRTVTLAVVLVCFAGVVTPWLLRNQRLCGSPFGTAGYSVAQQTWVFPGDDLERSLDPRYKLQHLTVRAVGDKCVTALHDIAAGELLNFTGNWLGAFFLVSLFIPFRNPAIRRMRWFIVGSLVIFLLVEAAGRTHLSAESPRLSSENLLVLVAPLAFVYGAGLFYLLLDQLDFMTVNSRNTAVGAFVVALSLPLVFSILAPPDPAENSPYAPGHIQQTSRLMGREELMMSDIPWAVAWYGDRPCAWLALNDDEEFNRLEDLKNVHAVFLTQRTSAAPLLDLAGGATNSWGRFFWDGLDHAEMPDGFPLKKAPTGFLPDQFLITDSVRW